MKYLFCVLLLWKVSTPQALPNHISDHCGLSLSDRIVGGSNAALGQYPWMARLGYQIKEQIRFDCGGSLVSERHVLTAAHCESGLPEDVKILYVDLGENIVDHEPDCEDSVCANPVQRFTVSSIKSHDNYNKPSYKNDIAIITLSSKAKITQWVLPVCLPFGATDPSGFAEVAGFGLSKVQSEYRTPNLQTLKVPLLDLKQCKKMYEPAISIGKGQMCVGGKLGKDSCAGDSGGPLVKAMSSTEFVGPRYFIIGIVSFGMTSCGTTTTPFVCTDVSTYLPWIVKHIK